MTNSRTCTVLAFAALTVVLGCHNDQAPTQPPAGEIVPNGDDESVSGETPEPSDDDGAQTDELGPAELEVAQPGRVSSPD